MRMDVQTWKQLPAFRHLVGLDEAFDEGFRVHHLAQAFVYAVVVDDGLFKPSLFKLQDHAAL